MNNLEFSTEFDVLYNNITSNQAAGLNEYEKSVFLTKAQDQLVQEYFNPKTDGVGGGFDGDQKRQYDFSSIIKVANLVDVNAFTTRVSDLDKLDKRSLVYLFPQDYFLAVNEIISDAKWQYSVMPIDYAEYQRLMLKPYNFPVKRGVWRLLTGTRRCNYYHEYVQPSDFPASYDSDMHPTDNEYIVFSTWNERSATIKLTIIYDSSSFTHKDTMDVDTTVDEYDYMSFKTFDGPYVQINGVYEFNENDSSELDITLTAHCTDYIDDKQLLGYIQEGFERFPKEQAGAYRDTGGVLRRIIDATDGLSKCVAPTKSTEFGESEGKTFTTSYINVPTAEIIGKFHGDLQYQLRYVKTLKPIILEDLDNYGVDLSIKGITAATECELSAETHQEILERAVTLAKIAWAGGTATQAAAAQK